MGDSTWVPRRQEQSAPNYVIDQIRTALFNRTLNPGDKMPSETELCNMFGVSRGSVRQAMKSLETLGVVSIKPGNGTYINHSVTGNSFNPLAFALLISQPTTKTLGDARYALERDILELILEKESRVEMCIPRLENNIAEREELIKNGGKPEELADNDQLFHQILSDAAENVLLKIVYDYIVDAFRQYFINSVINDKDDALNDHIALLSALKARNFNEAKKASKASMLNWEKSV